MKETYSEYKSKYVDIVRFYADALGLPVYAINHLSYFKVDGSNHSINRLTPTEFIGVIENASLIITSSFHGVAFSINFKKNFIALKTRNPKRIDNLLSLLHLEDRLLDRFDEVICRKLLEDIDYTRVEIILGRERKESIKWLKDNIENV